jgi:phytoene dehydrogenase-like protein
VTERWDAVVVGGGHNGLVAAAYLAQAGLSVLVLERLDVLGGAAVSSRPFPGVDVNLSRYSYLVSLLPRAVIKELRLDIRLARRRMSSYSPVRDTGLLIDTADDARTAESFTAVTGSAKDATAWREFYAMTRKVAEAVFPTLTSPLPSRQELRARIADDAAWNALFEEPIAAVIEKTFSDDLVRGVALTDALIGTFARAGDPDLRQNRCFLYHVIGNGTGDWDVPVGGMGAVTRALSGAARAAGAELVTGAEVASITPDGEVTYRRGDEEHVAAARYVLANVAPSELSQLVSAPPDEEKRPEGSQLKINMVLNRLPWLRDRHVRPEEAFGGTFHVNEGYRQLDTAYAQAAAGSIPRLPPCEIYCHSLTDPTILGPEAGQLHTLTLFGLHMPARLFSADKAKQEAMRATLASLNSVLETPIEECLASDINGKPCLEAKTPVDLENELGLPGGNIFHKDLSWPYSDDHPGTWGVETEYPRILVCGAGAIRGGGVSGIPGRNAAMKILRSPRAARAR